MRQFQGRSSDIFADMSAAIVLRSTIMKRLNSVEWMPVILSGMQFAHLIQFVSLDLYPQSHGTGLLRIGSVVAEESRTLEDPQSTVELHRLQGQYQMASKGVLHAVDVDARAARPSDKEKLLAKAPVYFHSKPDKFRELVKNLKNSWKAEWYGSVEKKKLLLSMLYNFVVILIRISNLYHQHPCLWCMTFTLSFTDTLF